MLQLYGDEARFKAEHGEATARAVLRFYVTDASNGTSIAASVRMARANANRRRSSSSSRRSPTYQTRSARRCRSGRQRTASSTPPQLQSDR